MRFTITLEAPEGMMPEVFERLVRAIVELIKAHLKLRSSLVKVTTEPEITE